MFHSSCSETDLNSCLNKELKSPSCLRATSFPIKSILKRFHQPIKMIELCSGLIMKPYLIWDTSTWTYSLTVNLLMRLVAVVGVSKPYKTSLSLRKRPSCIKSAIQSIPCPSSESIFKLTNMEIQLSIIMTNRLCRCVLILGNSTSLMFRAFNSSSQQDGKLSHLDSICWA